MAKQQTVVIITETISLPWNPQAYHGNMATPNFWGSLPYSKLHPQPVVAWVPSFRFYDQRNSMYLGLIH
jgi:hypothetical protein